MRLIFRAGINHKKPPDPVSGPDQGRRHLLWRNQVWIDKAIFERVLVTNSE